MKTLQPAAVLHFTPEVFSRDEAIQWFAENYDLGTVPEFYYIEDDKGKIIAITGNGDHSKAHALAIATYLESLPQRKEKSCPK